MNQFYKGKNNEFIEAAYAPSNRSTCRRCKQKIPKESIRLSYNQETENHYSAYWYHLNCFELKKKFMDIDPMQEIYNIDQIDGNATDMDIVIDYIEAEKTRLKNGEKWKQRKESQEEKDKDDKNDQEDKDDEDFKGSKKDAKRKKKEEKKEQQKVKEPAYAYTAQQQKEYEQLLQQYGTYTADKLKQMLTANNQSKTGNKAQLIQKCADGKIMGQIPQCPKCGGGRPKFDKTTSTYKCPGYMDDDKYRHCHKTFKIDDIQRPKWIDA